MEQEIIGSIKSSELGEIGKIKYGFIGVETQNHKILEVKVTGYTLYDTLKVGDKVRIVGESLGKRGLWSAKSIRKIV